MRAASVSRFGNLFPQKLWHIRHSWLFVVWRSITRACSNRGNSASLPAINDKQTCAVGAGTMGKHRIRILGTTTLVALVVGTTQALAGGLAIREQSAWGEGASYAGVAAGGSVSAMFWNPATMTQTGKFALENSAALIFPQSSQTGTNNVSALLGLPPAFQGLSLNDGTPNSGQAAFAPSAYATFKLNDRLWARRLGQLAVWAFGGISKSELGGRILWRELDAQDLQRGSERRL